LDKTEYQSHLKINVNSWQVFFVYTSLQKTVFFQKKGQNKASRIQLVHAPPPAGNFLRVLMTTVICAYGLLRQFTKRGY
jgi:hypothetical protein